MPVSDVDDVRRRVAELLAGHDPSTMPVARFRGAQFDAGLAWIWFPPGCGGLGAPPELQDVVDAALSAAGVPANDETSGIGLAMVAPTLVAHGSETHQRRYLRPIFTGEEVWCQLFSEPGSGSDLAGLSTTVVRDGDEWSISGQKVWTSFAHIADLALCLARSDVDAPKHRGLTYFIVDMHAPGIEVRPLREMTGEAQFSEVFLTGVVVPDECRLGAVGDGWRVSLSTLMSERAGMGDAPLGSAAMADALGEWQRAGIDDPVKRDRLAAFWVRSEAYRLLNLKAQQLRQSGRPGPEGSLAKLACAELGQELYEFCMELNGAEGMLHPDAYAERRVQRGDRLLAGRDTHWLFLRSRGFTIEGGTSQIQRNVIGERILGLPADISVDRDLPWRSIRRG